MTLRDGDCRGPRPQCADVRRVRTYKLGEALWAGYKEDGVLGAMNAVHPLFQIARGAADTYLAIERDDYRAAGAAGVTNSARRSGSNSPVPDR